MSRPSARGSADAELVSRALLGETEAFSCLVDRHRHAMLASARQLVADPDQAVDLAQEAFIEAFRSLRNLRDPANFRPWLFGILRNRCRKHIARRRLVAVPLDEETDIAAPMAVAEEEDEDLGRIRAALDRLPPRYREVLTAHYLADMDYEEIALALGSSVNNVRVRCCRARERLRQLLSGEPTGRTLHDG